MWGPTFVKWAIRAALTIVTHSLFLAGLGIKIWEYRNHPYSNYIVTYDKYQEYFWEINVANIDLDMRRNSDREMICKGIYTPVIW